MQRLNKQQQELALKKQKYQLYASSPSQEEEKKMKHNVLTRFSRLNIRKLESDHMQDKADQNFTRSNQSLSKPPPENINTAESNT